MFKKKRKENKEKRKTQAQGHDMASVQPMTEQRHN